MTLRIVIPARMASVRLPGKPLRDIAGKPMIRHVWERCLEAGAASVVVATDSDAIREAATAFGADVALTRDDHPSGTDRVAEVVATRGWHEDVIVNVQGDEPLMPPEVIVQVAQLLRQTGTADIATLAVPIVDAAEWADPNCVKVVTDAAGFALLFSRAQVPHERNAGHVSGRRHLGLYAYRGASLATLVATPAAPLEQAEALEQLRALWIGQRIVVADACKTPPPGVDTEADLERAARALEDRLT